jgi:hypothetical protein
MALGCSVCYDPTTSTPPQVIKGNGTRYSIDKFAAHCNGNAHNVKCEAAGLEPQPEILRKQRELCRCATGPREPCAGADIIPEHALCRSANRSARGITAVSSLSPRTLRY